MKSLDRRALLLGLVVLWGCGGKQPANVAVPADAAVLEALAPCAPTHKLDDQGRVVELHLENKAVTDEALDQVRALSELRTLSLYGSAVTDAGLAKLAEMHRLESLGLGKTCITQKGLKYVEKIRGLRWLWLTSSNALPASAVDKLKQARPGLTVYVQ